MQLRRVGPRPRGGASFAFADEETRAPVRMAGSWRVVVSGLVVVVAIACVVWDLGHTYDDPYILMRYARNLAGGDGWTLAPGESTANIATSTGYVLALAVMALAGLAIPLAATILFILGVAATAWFVHAERPGAGGGVAAALVILSPQLLSVRGMETWLLLGLISATAWALRADRQRAAGWLAVAAFLMRPDGVLVVVALAGWYRATRCRWPGRFLVIALIGTALVAAALAATVGIPSTLAAKRAQGLAPWWAPFGHDVGDLVGQAPVWWGLLLAGLAMNRRWLDQPALWCAVAYVAAYAVLGVASYPWYYAVPMLGLASAAGTGLGRVAPRSAVALAVLGALSVPRALPPQRAEMVEAGQWLRESAPKGATLGASEVGITGWYSDLAMRSYLGLLDPDRAKALGTPRMIEWVDEDRPDYLLVTYWAPDQATATAAADAYDPVWVGQHVQVWVRRDGGADDSPGSVTRPRSC